MDRKEAEGAPSISKSGSLYRPIFADEIFHAIQIVDIGSIKDAATKLQQLNKNWIAMTTKTTETEGLLRRQTLITEMISTPKLRTGSQAIPLSDREPRSRTWGIFSLIEKDKMMVSLPPELSTGQKPLISEPNGEFHFVEDKSNPPSRAYLKLYEAFYRLGAWPKQGQICMDLGACPGGWTWVLRQLGADVTAIDRTSLDERLMNDQHVTFFKKNAFLVTPDSLGQDATKAVAPSRSAPSTGANPATLPSGTIDWLVSDVVATPDRQIPFFESWAKSEKAKNLIFTVKLIGTDGLSDTVREINRLRKDLGIEAIHLFNNKNEFTIARILS